MQPLCGERDHVEFAENIHNLTCGSLWSFVVSFGQIKVDWLVGWLVGWLNISTVLYYFLFCFSLVFWDLIIATQSDIMELSNKLSKTAVHVQLLNIFSSKKNKNPVTFMQTHKHNKLQTTTYLHQTTSNQQAHQLKYTNRVTLMGGQSAPHKWGSPFLRAPTRALRPHV